MSERAVGACEPLGQWGEPSSGAEPDRKEQDQDDLPITITAPKGSPSPLSFQRLCCGAGCVPAARTCGGCTRPAPRCRATSLHPGAVSRGEEAESTLGGKCLYQKASWWRDAVAVIAWSLPAAQSRGKPEAVGSNRCCSLPKLGLSNPGLCR